MAQSEPTPPEATPCDGSELLDHRKLLLGSQPKQPYAIPPPPGPLDITALLDAALADDSARKELFRDALLHYRLAAEEMMGAEVISPETAGSPLSSPGDLLPPGALPDEPENAVVLAVIDEGLPFARPALNAHLASVWVMAADPRGAVPFGAEITGTDLAGPKAPAERLRGAPALYDRLGVSDIASRSGRRMRGFRTHGASVMALALEGLDRQHPVIAVGFPAEVVRDTSGALLPFFILLGVLHVLSRTRAVSAQIGAAKGVEAPDLPVVINISYGVLSGPKDGSDPLSRALDALCDPDRPAVPGLGPVHVVWPMGNGRQVQSHAIVEPDTGPLSLQLLPDDRTPSYVSLRAPTPDDGSFGLQASVCLPGGTVWSDTPANPTPGTRVTLPLRGGHEIHAYFDREHPPQGQPRDLIILAFGPTVRWDYLDASLPAGRWGLRATAAAPVELFVQRDDSIVELRSGGRQARLGHDSYRRWTAAGREIEFDTGGPPISPIRRTRTVNAFAAGSHIWRIGGKSSREDLLAPYSGLTEPGNPKRPEGGDAVMASDRSRTVAGIPVGAFFGGTWIRETGTSVAAPQAARAIALTMSEHREHHGTWPNRTYLSQTLDSWPPRPDPQDKP